ncbi:IS66 family transposase zinc-finger binding domain-containing protein [Methylovirgula sp. HY1]|uniref:IS66 family transposase zinc-finger binding domain-containing protein n=1 Tax=Methylovirgula sp. HY1 TaxID=2822761 RepID=UPI001C5A5F8D|nr:IS66 family transposase zinc-finger binding domain-containing protein [Methylovirgula sp. HY1]
MSASALPIPDDIESLRLLVAAQRAELDAERVARAQAEAALVGRDLLIEKLKAQIAKLKRIHFGQSSEKLKTEIEQLELALEELETAEAEQPVRPEPAERLRPVPVRSLPAHLPREEVLHLPASGDCVCPSCGGKLHRLGEDSDEVLDIEPITYKVVRHVRPKFSCRACEKIVQAPAPAKAAARQTR